MLPTLTALLVLLPASGFAPSASDPVALVAQDPVPDKREEVAEMLGRFKDHLKARHGAEDKLAIDMIEGDAKAGVPGLLSEFEKSGPKDRKAIVQAVSSCFKQKRKTDKDGNRDNQLFLAAARALGQMGPESVKELQSWIGHKSHKKDLDVQAELVKSLGKTKDDKSVQTLIDLLDHKDATIQAAAAIALDNYSDRDQKVRKEIFEEVLKVLTSVYNLVETDITDNIARDRLDAIMGAMITTLQTMSGQNIDKPDKFRSWWNNNKKKNWDED